MHDLEEIDRLYAARVMDRAAVFGWMLGELAVTGNELLYMERVLNEYSGVKYCECREELKADVLTAIASLSKLRLCLSCIYDRAMRMRDNTEDHENHTETHDVVTDNNIATEAESGGVDMPVDENNMFAVDSEL